MSSHNSRLFLEEGGERKDDRHKTYYLKHAIIRIKPTFTPKIKNDFINIAKKINKYESYITWEEANTAARDRKIEEPYIIARYLVSEEQFEAKNKTTINYKQIVNILYSDKTKPPVTNPYHTPKDYIEIDGARRINHRGFASR